MAIAKFLRLKPIDAHIVLSSLNFKAKESIFKTLALERLGPGSKVSQLVNQITSFAERNAVVHGVERPVECDEAGL